MVVLQGDGAVGARARGIRSHACERRLEAVPDGRMETTLRIRDGAKWQDGQPFTSSDLAFTADVSQDKDLALLAHPGYKFLEGYHTPDERTFIARWKQPYIDADKLFNAEFTIPIPRHILEKPYQEDKAGFLQHAYWSTEFVGTGPFKLRNWDGNTYLVLAANDSFVLGRPKVDEIEVRFIPDPNALITNVLRVSSDVPGSRAFAGAGSADAQPVAGRPRGHGAAELARALSAVHRSKPAGPRERRHAACSSSRHRPATDVRSFPVRARPRRGQLREPVPAVVQGGGIEHRSVSVRRPAGAADH